MTRNVAVAAGAAGVVVVSLVAVALLGGDPPARPPLLPARTDVPPVPDPPPPVTATEPPARTERPDAPPPVAPTERPPTGTGDALLRQVREVVARGERAEDEAAERAAAGDLAQVLADLKARGEAALPDALALLGPGEPPGVQEVGARALGAIGTTAALEALAEFARTPGPGLPRLQALRALDASPVPFARGALVEVAQDGQADLEVRCYAVDLMRDLTGAEAILDGVARDVSQPPELRAMALDALLALEPARGREALEALGAEPALAPHLEALRRR